MIWAFLDVNKLMDEIAKLDYDYSIIKGLRRRVEYWQSFGDPKTLLEAVNVNYISSSSLQSGDPWWNTFYVRNVLLFQMNIFYAKREQQTLNLHVTVDSRKKNNVRSTVD